MAKKPKRIKGDSVTCYDIDNTLVVWDKHHLKASSDRVKFVNPFSKVKLYLKPHKVHIRMLKEHKLRGDTIIAWSNNSGEWAEEVIKKLGLSDYVDYIMTKPRRHIDDKPEISEVIGHRIYLEDAE